MDRSPRRAVRPCYRHSQRRSSGAVFALSGVAWLLFGAGFHLLCLALTGVALTSLTASIAAFTASYLAGFLAFFAPGGLGVRELGMQTMLAAYGVSPATAIVMAGASRLWLTVLEIGPALVFLARKPARPMNRTACGARGRGVAPCRRNR